MSHLFSLGHPWPICFPWASLTIFLTLRSHGFLLTPLSFLDPITLSFILGTHGLAINPLLSLLALLRAYVTHSHFSTSHTAHEFVTSLSLGSFRPICFLKAHLFISWTCDPLFLLLGLNGFSIHLLTLFYPCCRASCFYWASQNEHQQCLNPLFPISVFIQLLKKMISFLLLTLNKDWVKFYPITKISISCKLTLNYLQFTCIKTLLMQPFVKSIGIL